ncbi:hypothetical protein D3C71_1814200 [compost metagenome]
MHRLAAGMLRNLPIGYRCVHASGDRFDKSGFAVSRFAVEQNPSFVGNLVFMKEASITGKKLINRTVNFLFHFVFHDNFCPIYHSGDGRQFFIRSMRPICKDSHLMTVQISSTLPGLIQKSFQAGIIYSKDEILVANSVLPKNRYSR